MIITKFVTTLLTPFGWLYGAVVQVRSGLFARGLLKSQDLQVPTISVGNITVGGTGKTPLVALVAKILAANGYQPCILTRGYKRENPSVRVIVSDGQNLLAEALNSGDEPFELAINLRGIAAVIADKKRVAAGIWARENFGTNAFILDDGFQHRQLQRDLDIVTIDATNPYGNGELLPAGILREPLENLQRAGLIILTRTDLVAPEIISALQRKISSFNQTAPILTGKTKITSVRQIENGRTQPQTVTLDPQQSPIPTPKPQIALAFCALGNPHGFFASLRAANFQIAATEAFPDHHRYTPNDIAKIEKLARRNGAEILLTTAKDAVKLMELKFNLPCLVVEIEFVPDDEKPLRELLEKVCPRRG